MKEIAFYMSALAVMYDLCFQNQQNPQREWKTWSLPDYNVQITLKTEGIRYAVWGLMSGVLYDASEGLWPMLLEMVWKGNQVGQINFSYRSFPSNITDADFHGTNTSALVGEFQNSTRTLLDAASRIQYNVTHNGRQISVGHLFQIVLSVLVYSADTGPNEYFQGFISENFTFMSALDGNRKPLMTHRDLIKVMTYVATMMVERNYFVEVDIAILRDGVRIGDGRLRNSPSTED